MPVIKLSSKGQIAIPKAIRDQLGLRKDMRLSIAVEGRRIVLEPAPEGSWEDLEGILKRTKVLELLEEEHRREIEAGGYSLRFRSFRLQSRSF